MDGRRAAVASRNVYAIVINAPAWTRLPGKGIILAFPGNRTGSSATQVLLSIRTLPNTSMPCET